MQQYSYLLLIITVLRDILSIDDTLDIMDASAIYRTRNASDLEPYFANNKTESCRTHDRP